jgi:hypothetical protein
MWDDDFSWGDDDDWWQQQDNEREHHEFVRTLLLATLIAIYKELENVNGKLQ